MGIVKKKEDGKREKTKTEKRGKDKAKRTTCVWVSQSGD